MISLTLFNVNFDELNIANLSSKRALLESLKIFYNKSENEYLEFLEHLNLNFYKKFNNIFELNNELNKEIEIFNKLASNEELNDFNFKANNLIKRALKPINDNEYLKLNLDLRSLNNNDTLDKIKDIFILTDSVSLVDFKEIEEQRVSLIYHRKGASIYDNELVLANSRDKINLLENFKEAKDNNFIVARFLLELSREMKKASIDESFSYTYEIGGAKKEMIKNLDEIIFWGDLNKEEKEKLKIEQKQQQELSEKALEQAKSEIKEERDLARASLQKNSIDSTDTSLNNEKTIPKIDNIRILNKQEQNARSKNALEFSSEDESKKEIEKIIADSFKLYHQKEIEKTNIRLDKAKKDSVNAYEDLKANLDSGSSIIEALKFIQQKYRNEDTINFASLLFSNDILNLKIKEEEIKNLKIELQNSHHTQKTLNDEITKREESISKLKGTIQSKVNEITALKLELEEKTESLKEKQAQLNELQKHSNEQELSIKELNIENRQLSDTNKALNEEKIKLETSHKHLELSLKESKEKELFYTKELEKFKLLEKNVMKFELEKEFLEQKESEYKDKINALENKLENLIDRVLINSNDSQQNTEAKSKKQLRSKDILGDV